MKIYTKAGELAFKTFTFPDGQPHFILETYEVDFNEVTVETAIKSPSDLVLVCLVSSVLRQHGYSQVNLDVRYLLGARMDRAIGWNEPFTLDVVARIINSCGFSRVRILDAHSEVATRLIRNSTNLLPRGAVLQAVNALGGAQIVIPDKGATDRVMKMLPSCLPVQAFKRRDTETGVLSGFGILDAYLVKNASVLIVDDICDGGGTFVGEAQVLREAGAKTVNLFVTHGIFSKGLPLKGIDRIYTTDSFCEGTKEFKNYAIVIPISMKDLK